MRLSLKTVSTLVVCAAGWLMLTGPLCARQTEARSSSGASPAAIQPEIQPPTAPPAGPQKALPPAPAGVTKVIAQTPPETSPQTPVAKPSTESKITPAGLVGSQKIYVIGPLDVLYIKVWNQPQLTGAVDVRPDGILSMSLIGELKADGLTAAQLKEAIQTRLGDFLNNPEVDVQVVKVNSKRYYVYGGVFSPGEFPLIETTTVMDALSVVGGFKDFAKPTKITIKRGNETFHFNYKDFTKGRNADKNVNIELQNGDRIFVPE